MASPSGTVAMCERDPLLATQVRLGLAHREDPLADLVTSCHESRISAAFHAGGIDVLQNGLACASGSRATLLRVPVGVMMLGTLDEPAGRSEPAMVADVVRLRPVHAPSARMIPMAPHRRTKRVFLT